MKGSAAFDLAVEDGFATRDLAVDGFATQDSFATQDLAVDGFATQDSFATQDLAVEDGFATQDSESCCEKSNGRAPATRFTYRSTSPSRNPPFL